jgi:serine/threonine-protein kinase
MAPAATSAQVSPGAVKKSEEVAGPSVWPTLGYEPLTAQVLEAIARAGGKMLTPGKPAVGTRAGPAGLTHKRDGDIFYRFVPGIYLPLGYLPENPHDTVNSWPRVLVRASDRVRFIRIAGGTYTAGDFRATTPAIDAHGNPLQTHDVKLSGFYIQETEVTIGEIKEYPTKILYPTRIFDEREWENLKSGIQILKKMMTTDHIDRLPAVFINRATAQNYARWVGGRLPTEAEWEYAARSGGKNHRWACSSAIAAKKRSPKAHLWLPSDTKANPFPRPVKSFPEDQTEQGVFDMTGNVQEWCLDVYRPYAEIIAANRSPGQPLKDPRVGDEPDPANPKVEYVVRGGSYFATANDAMVFQRSAVAADSQLNYLGFRVVIPCPPEVGEPGE